MTSFHIRLLLTAAYSAASAGCPLARRARVTSVPDPQYIRTCYFYWTLSVDCRSVTKMMCWMCWLSQIRQEIREALRCLTIYSRWTVAQVCIVHIVCIFVSKSLEKWVNRLRFTWLAGHTMLDMAWLRSPGLDFKIIFLCFHGLPILSNFFGFLAYLYSEYDCCHRITKQSLWASILLSFMCGINFVQVLLNKRIATVF